MTKTKGSKNIFIDIQKDKIRLVNMLLAQSLNCLNQAKVILDSVAGDLTLLEQPRSSREKDIYSLDDHRKK